MKTDIEIAQEAKMKPITQIAAQLGLEDESVIPYGRYKAKIDHRLIHNAKKQGKLILVTAISPTPAGEGKTTTSVGLADAMNALGKKTMLCLREPSLGPVFGVKGGAAGGGYAQVVPMEDINLHFTGDLHAIGTANNLLAAMIDNSIQQGNPLNIDPRRITWKRCMDMNDRQLRFIVDGLGGKVNGTPREDGFDITVASEVMAIFCLATSISDLKERLSRIVVAYTYEGQPVTAGQIGAAGAREVHENGVGVWLTPAINIHRTPLCGRNFEYYSEDPLVSGKMAAAMTRGVQAHKGCGTTIKHYAANNKEYNRTRNNSMVSERAMREIYLKGFGICVRESQPKAVMTSYNLLNGTHTAESRGLVMDILRAEFGYQGIVMTDWVTPMTGDARSAHRDSQAQYVAAAGGDLFMPGSKGDYDNLLQGIDSGAVTLEQVKINASRVVKMARALTQE